MPAQKVSVQTEIQSITRNWEKGARREPRRQPSSSWPCQRTRIRVCQFNVYSESFAHLKCHVLDVKDQLPTAASVKLLLDVPEGRLSNPDNPDLQLIKALCCRLSALYAYLAGKQFLEAAYLWLLTRVVKEELVNSSADATGDREPGQQVCRRRGKQS